MIEITRVKYDHPPLFNGDKVQAIIKEVCMYFDVNEYQLKSKARNRPILFARHLAIYMIRNFCGNMYSLKGIGKMFGNRDHATCINSITEVRNKLSIDPTDPLSEAYYEITKKLPFL